MPARTRSRRRALYGTAVVFWFLLAGIATTPVSHERSWLVPRIGQLRAHQLGTLLVCALFLMAITVFVQRVRPSTREALYVGAWWTLLAVGFEFGLRSLRGRIVLESPALRLRRVARPPAVVRVAHRRAGTCHAHQSARRRSARQQLRRPSLGARQRDRHVGHGPAAGTIGQARSRRPGAPAAASQSQDPTPFHSCVS